jgi:hypothetical protein
MKALLMAPVIVVLTALAAMWPGAVATAATPHPGLPSDAPAALYRTEPTLPTANGWPASDTAFPRTSGTSRLAAGGKFWTDYLYDDHGATTTSTGGLSVTAGSPSFGTFTYPAGAAHGNGADIFRSAVALRGSTSYWRVDWNTLADPRVPIAEWTFDRDDRTSTGGSTWPGAAGVSSPGIGAALIVSSRGAEVVDVVSGKVTAHLHTTVDRAAHSFVVAVPKHVLHPTGTWRVRLAAGVADGSGTGFAPAPDAVPGQTHVYNVAFRTRAQETPSDNFWNDMAQTSALDSGTVAQFSSTVRWAQLRHRDRTSEPHPLGWSDRWYVSDVNLGPGIVTAASTISDGKPNYLGRVQPYAVYVPRHRPHKAPLTFLLHSLTQNHNQYAATTPHFTQQACEARHSICVTTLGRGPDGNYYDAAELDFWQVWHAVASTYPLNPDRTVVSGYSMGGIGTNQLTMAHPDLFARGVTLAGAVGDVPSLVNLRWVPTYLAGGAEDELVPVTTERAEANRLDALGDRYRWLVIPALDHVSYELADSFADAAAYMGHASRVRDPGAFTFTWTPRNTEQTFGDRGSSGGGISWTQLPKLGVGTTGDYWVRDLHPRTHAHDASIRARSAARPDRSITAHRSQRVDPGVKPEPSLESTLTWTRGARPHRHPRLTLHLTNVRSLHVLARSAGFRAGQHGVLHVKTDGAVTISLGGRRIHVAKGSHVVRFRA